MPRVLVALAAVACASACKRPPDPFAAQRAACAQLAAAHQLRAGLTVESCARELQQRQDAADPARHAEELAVRAEALVQQGRVTPTPAQREELRQVLAELQGQGPAAIAPLQARLRSSDADLRIAAARVLVSLCAGECGEGSLACIVPALLEGTGDDRPPEVRRESMKGLRHCTGAEIGDDPAAWRRWWAERAALSAGASAERARQ